MTGTPSLPRTLVVLTALAALTSSGCAHHLYLRPVATVRAQAERALACDEVQVRRLSGSHEMRAPVDGYEARGCGRVYYAICDGPRSRGGCSGVPRAPAQGVAPGLPRASVELIPVHRGWAAMGADSMWERVDLGDGYEQRLLPLRDPAPLRFDVAPGLRRVGVSTGPSGVHQETRIRAYNTRHTELRFGQAYEVTETHYVPYQVAVRQDAPGCSASATFRAEANHRYRVAYLSDGGECAMACADITDGTERACVAY